MDQPNRNPLNETASQIEDPDFQQLANELDGVVNFHLNRNQMVIHLLYQAVYPLGAAAKRYRIDGSVIDSLGALDTTLGKLRRGSVYGIGDRLAQLQGESTALYETKKLYVFLNQLIPELGKKRSKYKIHSRDIPSV